MGTCQGGDTLRQDYLLFPAYHPRVAQQRAKRITIHCNVALPRLFSLGCPPSESRQAPTDLKCPSSTARSTECNVPLRPDRQLVHLCRAEDDLPSPADVLDQGLAGSDLTSIKTDFPSALVSLFTTSNLYLKLPYFIYSAYSKLPP